MTFGFDGAAADRTEAPLPAARTMSPVSSPQALKPAQQPSRVGGGRTASAVPGLMGGRFGPSVTSAHYQKAAGWNEADYEERRARRLKKARKWLTVLLVVLLIVALIMYLKPCTSTRTVGKADVVFALDMSGSVSDASWSDLKQATELIIDAIDTELTPPGGVADQSNLQAGGAKWSTSLEWVQTLSAELPAVKTAIQSATKNGGGTCIGLGLASCGNMFDFYGDEDAQNICVVLTDGVFNDGLYPGSSGSTCSDSSLQPITTDSRAKITDGTYGVKDFCDTDPTLRQAGGCDVNDMASLLKDPQGRNTTIIAVFIGSSPPDGLRNLASCPASSTSAQCSNLIQVDDTTALIDESGALAKRIAEAARSSRTSICGGNPNWFWLLIIPPIIYLLLLLRCRPSDDDEPPPPPPPEVDESIDAPAPVVALPPPPKRVSLFRPKQWVNFGFETDDREINIPDSVGQNTILGRIGAGRRNDGAGSAAGTTSPSRSYQPPSL